MEKNKVVRLQPARVGAFGVKADVEVTERAWDYNEVREDVTINITFRERTTRGAGRAGR